MDGEIVELVRPGQVHRGVVGDTGADRIPGAAVGNEAVAECEQPAVVVEARLDIVDLIARMAGGHEVLVPVLDPPNRPFHGAREERNEQFLGIDVAFHAKTAADIERDATDARLGHVQHGGSLAPQPVHDLTGRPDRNGVGAFVVNADDAAALHRDRTIAVVVEAPLEPVRRARQRSFDVALGQAKLANHVGVVFVMQDRSAGLESRLGIHNGRQRLEIEGDQLGRVFREIAVFSQDDRDRLADMAHLVVGEQRLLRIEELVLDLRGPFPRQRQLGVGDRREQLREFRAVEHIRNAGRRRRARQVDRADARVRHLASHEHGMQRVGKLQIGHELAAAHQQASVLATRQRASDVSVALPLCHPPNVLEHDPEKLQTFRIRSCDRKNT